MRLPQGAAALVASLGIAWALLGPLAPGLARAEAWELKGGLGPAFGTELDPGKQEGLGGQVYLQLGVSEVFSITAGGGYVHHFLGTGDPGRLLHAGVGVAASLDVLALVPYLELRLGYLYQACCDAPGRHGLGVVLALGADYLWTDSFTAGLALEYHGMLTDLEVLPAYLSVNLRAGFRFLE